MKFSNLVLHVDDDPSILKLVAKKLQSHGVKVVSISDPLVAIDKILETGARVVVLDIDMPGKDGLTLLEEIKHLDGGIQVIMCTGMVSFHTVLRATRLGAETCIFKPILNLNEVSEAIDRAFEKIDRMWGALREWLERKKAADDRVQLTNKTGSKLAAEIHSMGEEARGKQGQGSAASFSSRGPRAPVRQ